MYIRMIRQTLCRMSTQFSDGELIRVRDELMEIIIR